jgi:hypothetical protein
MNIYSRSNPPQGFYVYAYLREDGTPYYIGKGKGNRAWVLHSNNIIVPDKCLITICESNLSELGAFALERRLINWYGRINNNTGMLMNKSLGGEGSSGYKHTPDAIAKLKARTPTDKWRENHSRRMSGEGNPTKVPEVAKKISDALTGKAKSEGHIQKMSAAKLGKKQPASVGAAASAYWSGRTRQPQKEAICPYCNKNGNVSNMVRWHFDNCKSRKLK